jgi:NAD(P)-dependent dehydrogenase (short-subunit alcohol dehydrogenase family)
VAKVIGGELKLPALSCARAAAFAAAIPLNRMGRPDEIAAAALFLASDDSSFVAGAELSVDGGMAQV